MGGSFPMEVKSKTMQTYHTTELEHEILEQCFFIATLRVPQQGSSAVTYLLPVLVTHRACMWGYILVLLVSPVC